MPYKSGIDSWLLLVLLGLPAGLLSWIVFQGVSGPFNWTVPLTEVKRIERSRSLASSARTRTPIPGSGVSVGVPSLR